MDESGEVVSRNTELLVRPKEFAFTAPKFTLGVKKLDGNRFECSVSSDCLARRVKLSFDGIDVEDVSDQYFDITSNSPVCVTVTVRNGDVTAEDIKASLHVLSEADLVLIRD